MRKKVLPLVLTFALALSPVSEAFASAELSPDPVSSESAESMPEEISQDEAVTQILEESYTETAENTETETPELVPEAETEDEFSLCYCVNCGEFLQQFLDFCFEVFDLGGTLHQVVATINQEEVGHGLNVVKHQAL